MGGILSALRNKENESVVLDFEGDSTPADSESVTFNKMQEVLSRREEIMEKLNTYEGCQNLVQVAISSPSKENLAAAWDALNPVVAMLKSFYDYALELEAVFLDLVIALCSSESVDLETHLALAKQLAALLDFVIRFDHTKMNTPSIQNDFSYYRRSMARMKREGEGQEGSVSSEVANRMSFFYASPTPTMNTLTSTISGYLLAKKEQEEQDAVNGVKNTESTGFTLATVCKALAALTNSCKDMLKNGSFENEKTNLFCCRTMTSSIIVYDQLHELGAWHKKSPINIKQCLTVLSDWKNSDDRLPLVNMLRYTSKHLQDDSTPGLYLQMLESAGTTNDNNDNNNT